MLAAQTGTAGGVQAPRLQGRTKCLRMCALEGVGDAEKEMFVGHGPNELEADGQTAGSETARDGNRRDAGEIGGAVVAKQERASGMILFVHARGFFVDKRGGDR